MDAYNSFSSSNIESGDFLFILVENEEEECLVDNVIDSGSFVKIQAKCDDEFIYDYSIVVRVFIVCHYVYCYVSRIFRLILVFFIVYCVVCVCVFVCSYCVML